MSGIQETAINIIAEETRIEGKVIFERITRVHGVLIGEVIAKDGSTLILNETSVVDGNIQADTVVVDGYVRGDITAKTRVVISRTGRVLGNVHTPTLKLEFGAYFDGQCKMEEAPATLNRVLKPAELT